MLDVLRAATSIASPTALIAFVVTILLFAYALRLRSRIQTMQGIPEKERLSYASDSLSQHKSLISTLTRKQKAAILQKDLEKRYRTSLHRTYIVAAVFLLSLAMVIVEHVLRSDEEDGATSSTNSVIFGSVDIATEQCAWGHISKPYDVLAPIKNVAGEYWKLNGGPKGTPSRRWPMGSHQLFPSLPPSDRGNASGLLVDPVFDITVLNVTAVPVTISRIGIRPTAAWTSPKGPPFSGPIVDCDAYVIEVKGFDPGDCQWTILHDCIYLSPHAPYRFRLCLRGLCSEIMHNELVLRVLLDTSSGLIESEDIYLGTFL